MSLMLKKSLNIWVGRRDSFGTFYPLRVNCLWKLIQPQARSMLFQTRDKPKY